MKVAQINSYSNGSTGHIAYSIHKALMAEENESLFAYGIGPDIGDGGYKISSQSDNFIHTVTTLFTGLHGYSSVHATKRLVKKLKAFAPDVVHLHNLHGGYLNLKVLFRYLKKANIQTVITVHDCWIYTGKCYHYYEAKCDKYMDKCGSCPQLSMYPKSYFFDFTKRMLKDKKKMITSLKKLSVITISEWLQNEVSKTFLGDYPINTIRNGVNDVFDLNTEPMDIKSKYGFGDKFIILGVASSWNTHKGTEDFIKLADMLSDDEEIVLVGGMPDNIKLPPNIKTISRTENAAELASIYNNASVYISMSTEETFGLTIAEALSCGVPAIVYEATACPEMIKNGQNGYIAKPHDIPQIYDFIQIIKCGDVLDRKSISEDAKSSYSKQRMVDSYLSLYRGFINENK